LRKEGIERRKHRERPASGETIIKNRKLREASIEEDIKEASIERSNTKA
jgi:hypothetical protein